MERRNNTTKKADAILTADWHLREDIPVCRTDIFPETQWKKVQFIKDLQKEHDCPVLHAGDLYEHWKTSPYLLSETMEYLPKDFNTVYGNHELPQHNLKLFKKSGTFTLNKAYKTKILPQGHFGITEPTNGHWTIKNRDIYVWHIMTYQQKEPYPGCTAPKAGKLLRQYPQFDLIVTGDNHQAFVEEYEGRLLVNPGSLTRQKADQIDFKPRVYLYYADTNTVKPVYLPIQEDAVTRNHLEIKEVREKRIEAFVSKLNDDYETTVSFEENLKRFQQKNNIEPEIMNVIYKMIS